MANHQSLDKKVKKKILQLKTLSCVKKIVIARSKSHRTAGRPQSFLRVQGDTNKGFKLLAYGERGVQELHLHLSFPGDEEAKERVRDWIKRSNTKG